MADSVAPERTERSAPRDPMGAEEFAPGATVATNRDQNASARPAEPAEPAAGRLRRSVWRALASAASALATFLATVALALAPLAAVVGLLVALGAALLALWRLVPLVGGAQILTNPQALAYLRDLDTAGRAGFVAAGYLALIFALMTLMAGLFGRRWGRLFILPGAVFTATSLALLGLALVYAAPLLAPVLAALGAQVWWLAVAAAYGMVDAVLVSGVMVDARLTRSPTATGQRRAIRPSEAAPGERASAAGSRGR